MSELGRDAMRALYRAPEAERVALLACELANEQAEQAYNREAVAERARQLVTNLREQRRHASGVDQLMHEFSLSSQEGVALMCLAEALLRIPDKSTVDRLIRDKIGHGDWQAHLGGSPSLFVNAATWGLMLSGKLVATHSHSALGAALSRLLRKGGEPLIRQGVDFAMRLLGQQFVMGETIAEALVRARANEERGYRHSFDMLGEAALTTADAERYFAAYASAIHAIGVAAAGQGVRAGAGISVKLSALHPRYQRSQRARVMAELLPRLRRLMQLACAYDIGLNIDAEEAERLELSLDLFEALAGDPELAGWQGMGFVVQAYQKRCPALIDWLIALARQQRRRLMIRLVKGAYWDSEIKRAQVEGLVDYPVFTRKSHTDLSYLVGAARLLAAPDAVYAQFATHNAHTLASVEQMARQRGVSDYEFQCLHGMGEPLYDHVVSHARPCRIYAPVGSHQTLLPYLVRRLLENGANSSFVHRLVDDQVSLDELVTEPLAEVAREGGQRHPAIPLPGDLYGSGRSNAAGLDLNDETCIASLAGELAALAGHSWLALPQVPGAPPTSLHRRPVGNPARPGEWVGEVADSDPALIALALNNAASIAPAWLATPPDERAAILCRAAELFEARRVELMALLIREAGKTWRNALGEVREAVDFCRYYGQQLNLGHFAGAASQGVPGPVVCISPWNFPLAIFVGQVTAALAAGRPVLAKPAGQTSLVAALAVHLLHAAGIPPAALQFLPGSGAQVGAALLADERVSGVLFTGSTDVARQINRQLAGRPGRCLIAETGGQNAMIVDSSALPEQVVQDVLLSAFDSAGQRCSALRVLCLQDDIADTVLALLRAAMAELVVGDPAELACDVGPVIDPAARDSLLAYIEQARRRGWPVFQCPLPETAAAGYFVPPTLIEISAATDMTREVFGPVLHVLRFAGDQLDALLEQINAWGYGLTMGLHSRIDETLERVRQRARVGNLYVNRNMIGAVVGVQPFGGEGLSGTGPKAGGPLFLPALSGAPQWSPASLGLPAAGHWPLPLAALAEWAQMRGDLALTADCQSGAMTTLLSRCLTLPGPTGECNELTFAPRGRMLCIADDEAQCCRQIAALLATGNDIALPDGAMARDLLNALPAAVQAGIELRPVGEFAGLVGVLLATWPHDDLHQRLAAEPGALIPVYQQGNRMNARSLPFKGVRTGFRRASLCAVRAGWLCKASPGAARVGMGHASTTGTRTTANYRVFRPIPLPASPLKGEECIRVAFRQLPWVYLPETDSGAYPLYRLLVERVVSINTAAAGGNTALLTLASAKELS